MKDDREFKRGVFTMPFRDVYGRRIAVAIDHVGRCVDWIAFRQEDRVAAYTRLWNSVLQEHDAVPPGPGWWQA